MKISCQQYAQALYEEVKDKKGKELEKKIENFVRLLKEKKCLPRAEKIAQCFSEIWDKSEGVVKAEAESARPLNRAAVKLLEDYLKFFSGARKAIVSQRINKELLGGAVLKYGDKVIDGSLRSGLLAIKEQMAK